MFNDFIGLIILQFSLKVKRNFNNLTIRRVMIYLGTFLSSSTYYTKLFDKSQAIYENTFTECCSSNSRASAMVLTIG